MPATPFTSESLLDATADPLSEEVCPSIALSATIPEQPSSAETGSSERDILYAEFAPLVQRLIRQYGQDVERRKDLAGEIYLRFCALFEAFDPSRGIPLRPYLVHKLTLATYTYARRQWRLKKREVVWEFVEANREQEPAFDPTVDWLTSLAQEQIADVLPAALENLPSRQRKVIIWRYYEERSFEDIAAQLGIQPSTVRSLLRHGLTALRKAIGAADVC